MTEAEILSLIKKDKWMMSVLKIASELNLPNWAIGAGFVRNKVWDYLHGYSKPEVDTNDIDLIYYDPFGNDEGADKELSKKLKERTGMEWEVVNEVYAHKWNDLPPYKSMEDALSQWPETATGIGVTIKNSKLRLVAPHGIDDLVNLMIRPSPKFFDGIEKVRQRAKEKKWLTKWPKLKIITNF